MHEIYTHPNSQAQFKRAAKVIPSGVYGHLGPAEGCFIPVEAFPLFSDHAKGSYFWLIRQVLPHIVTVHIGAARNWVEVDCHFFNILI